MACKCSSRSGLGHAVCTSAQPRRTAHRGKFNRRQGGCGLLQQSRLQRQTRLQASSTERGTVKVEETPEDAYQRRLRESQRVEERVDVIFSQEDWDRELDKAGSRLVVLEVESSEICQSGLKEEAELHWKADKAASLEPCSRLKHVLQRTARDCPDVTFLTLEADTPEGQALCDQLGVEVLPTLQFWKDKQKLWEHRGVLQLEQGIGEGVLYYGDSAANGVKASTYVPDLASREQFDKFLQQQDDKVLTVINVVLTSATPCIRVFAAVLALAKNFVGYAAFGRLIGDGSDETRQLLQELNIKEVPTFIFYRGGKEVGRHVGSSRGDLIGKILQQQQALGIAPPVPQQPGRPRKAAVSQQR
ncbi:hypothetical protein WJX72_009187 [[Myrmecia] bisecta]|uniref:Thioredoxin domain-containing protein n=1 Tax=[Myrmecia] bisecta TaxID=41462 RepID=A0AAW1PQG3_9CHLO